MPADEEIVGIEIAGADVNPTPILPPTTDPADTCDAYAEVEFAGECPAASAVFPDLSIDGDSCDSYAEVEYAGECVDATAVFPSLPASNVEEFNTSAGRLGCGTPLVFITSRCSGAVACQIELRDITRLVWNRRLNEASEAEVEIGLTGDSSQTCCQCLAIVEPFCHELHIWRDGEEVWVGPIEGVRYERERVTIKARDSLGWLDVRIPNEDVEFKTTNTGTITDNPLTTTATLINSAGFSALPTVVASAPVVIVVLNPTSTFFREVVQVVTHTAAATVITVVRAQQGTSALQHGMGTAWAFGGLSGPNSDITNIAKYVILTAFEEDTAIGHTCEIDHIYAVNTGEFIDWFSEGFNETALEVLEQIAETELNFTTLGRTIVLTGDTLSLTTLVLLNDEHIMGEIEVTKDGKLLGNRQWIHYSGDGGFPSLSQKSVEERFCYGLVERIKDVNEIQVLADAEAVGDAIIEASFIAPRVIDIPAGSRLSPDTPWTINQMVPGAKVDVAITKLCINLTQSFQLIGVSVEYTSNDGESIGIELTPINSTAGTL